MVDRPACEGGRCGGLYPQSGQPGDNPDQERSPGQEGGQGLSQVRHHSPKLTFKVLSNELQSNLHRFSKASSQLAHDMNSKKYTPPSQGENGGSVDVRYADGVTRCNCTLALFFNSQSAGEKEAGESVIIL